MIALRITFIFFLFFCFAHCDSFKGKARPTEPSGFEYKSGPLELFANFSLEEQSLKRKIVAFYDKKNAEDEFYSPTHQLAEMPLNHLGMIVLHHDIRDTLPQQSQMQDVHGVLFWMDPDSELPKPNTMCGWLNEQVEAGKKVVIVHSLKFFINYKQGRLYKNCETLLQNLGVKYFDDATEDMYYLEVVKKDSDMVEFERKLLFTEKLIYYHLKPNQTDVESFLTIRRKDLKNSESAIIFTSPRGGYINDRFATYINIEKYRMQWRVNPFLFFAKAFDIENWPKLDTTTLNGKRVFYSHIDGDGIFNVSQIDLKSFSGEIILKEILKQYAKIPISIGLITGYVDLYEYYNVRTKKLYKEILSLSNIEPASHGYAHPLIWQDQTIALQIPGYKFDAQKEVYTSMDIVNSLLQEFKISKKANLMQWTGDCLLSKEQIALPSYKGLLNINGGNTRFDTRYPSYASVSPHGIIKDGHLQVYTSMPNENVYTNLWHGPYGGFLELTETFANTESPIRVKPINIYYHFYSGERLASLTALKKVYSDALKYDIFPILTSKYVKLVEDFFESNIKKLSDNGYQIDNNSYIRTVRFDKSKNIFVDFKKSSGILGFKEYQGSLYIHLDESKTHKVYLTQKKPDKPFLRDASFFVRRFSVKEDTITFEKRGWYKSQMSLGGLKPNQSYKIEAMNQKFVAPTNQDGILELKFSYIEKDKDYSKVSIELQKEL